ncbi:PREDICTED: TATA box-binding protein-associated factor RNA polymerase I subunit B-like [Camelina sativa]|uniref:TATA box-binding protein-associated factor RNA polymerase I subunit B-like n=1 Tax=Camelina sativa TaxID=90675 RepID=A0ABM0ZD40_CAMSA|nr:PREDICTED: TATA box-binding protein-associated factor RNA polymerase I subunit B-like [Camelina sativa]
MTTIICKECDNEAFDEGEDGFFYCQRCGVMVDDMIQTGVDDGDLIGEGGDTQGAMYNNLHRRIIPHLITPSQPRYTQETMLYSQFRSHLESLSQVPKSGIEKKDLFREVKREPESYPEDEPGDFGAEPLSYEDYYDEARDRYVKAFLMMVTSQCDALVDKFNVTPLIIGLVGPICLRYVALSGVYDDDWADNAIRDSERQSEDGGELKDAKRPKTYRAEPRNLDGKRAVTIWVGMLKKTLPLSRSLAISFLACHKAGATVLPTDIVRWAREGKLPYLSYFLEIREKMGERSAACPVKTSIMARPFQILSAQMLESRAALIADFIGLPLPPVNFFGIASNYLKRLSIPEDKILDVVRLIQNWSMPPELYLSKNELKLPTRVCVMSILIVAIRMLYNINGFGVWERSLGLVNASEEDLVSEEFDSSVHDEEEVSETNLAAAESSDVTKATKFDTEELLKNLEAKYYEVAASETLESERDLLSYLSIGKNEFFAGLEEDLPNDTYRTVDNLWNSYPNDEELDRFRTPSKRGRDREDDLSLNQLSIDGSSPSRSNESVSMDIDLSSEQQVSSSPENHHQEETLKERAMKRLTTDMGENLFCYIPPRVKIKRLDYLQYVRKKEDGALIYAAHADYYILLRACAKVVEVDVRNMHRGVLNFERRLAWIEKRIDQVLYLTPPFMTCDNCCDGENVGEEQDDSYTNKSR